MKYSAGVCTECGKTSFIVSHKGGKEWCKGCNSKRLQAKIKPIANAKPTDGSIDTKRWITDGKTRLMPLKSSVKVKSISWLTKELDKWFSRFIRLRDVKNGAIDCITCTAIGQPMAFDCGHFIGRQYKSVRWHEWNAHAQCTKCNNWGEGEKYRYGVAINKKYGSNTAELLDSLRKQPHKWTRFEYETLIDKYKLKVAQLLIEKQIKAWW